MSDELTLLKERAETMGIPFHPNIGIEALKKKIQDKLEDKPDDKLDQEDDQNEPVKAQLAEPDAAPQRTLSKEEYFQQVRMAQMAEQRALVRVRITCLNPAKAHTRGEIFTVGNRFVGTIRRFVPFGELTDEGWHVERMILNEMKNRKFNSIRVVKRTVNGNVVEMPEARLVPEFAIEELPPLTQEEISKLARVQAAAAGN